MNNVNFTVEVYCQRSDWAMGDFIISATNKGFYFKGNAEQFLKRKFTTEKSLQEFKEKKFHTFNKTRYRIYVNNNLITERDWIWDNDIFLKENIWVERNHSDNLDIVLEPIRHIPSQAEFKIQNLKVLNRQAEIIQNNDTSYTLKIL